MKEYKTITRVAGPLIFVEKTEPVGYGELVKVTMPDGEVKSGQVLDTSQDIVVVQVFEGTSGIDLNSRVKFLGQTIKLPVSDELLGRILSGSGKPIDNGPEVVPEEMMDITGAAINPYARASPSDFIQTGISTIDGTNTLVRGQKLPLFSGSGLPHNEIALQIARQAKVVGSEEGFAIVFAAMGITSEESQRFISEFEETGALKRAVVFLNLADDPAVERLITPRLALTAAEYLAFRKGMHVLVILTDMTNYCVSGNTEMFSEDGEIQTIKEFVESRSKGSDVSIRERNESIKTWNGTTEASKQVARVQKLPSPTHMIELNTRTGNKVLLTPNHRLLADTMFGLRMTPAEQLKVGDKVAAVSKINVKSNTPSIADMLDENSIVFIKKELREEIKQDLKVNHKTLKNACKELGINYSRLTNPESFLKIKELRRLLRLYPGKDVESSITAISHRGGHRLNISIDRVNGDFLYVLGLVASDGSLIRNEKSAIYRVDFSNKERELIDIYRKKVSTIFTNIALREFPNQDGVIICRADWKAYYDMATFFGLGNKDFKKVFRLPEDFVAAFLRGYFDGDGSCIIGRHVLQYTSKDHIVAKRLQQLLKRTGISSIIVKRKSKGTFGDCIVFDVIIRGKTCIELFTKKIGSLHPVKIKRLEELSKKALESTEFEYAPRVCGTLIRLLRSKYGLKQTQIATAGQISEVERSLKRISKAELSKYIDKFSKLVPEEDEILTELKKLADAEFVLDEITSAKVLPPQELFVFDVTVPETGKFLVENGLIISNCESLREIGAARSEIPGRRGYPGYMYSVDGSRRVVIKDPAGFISVIEISRLFEILSYDEEVTSNGYEERMNVEGWEALSADTNGKASFKPILQAVRHKYSGKLCKITTQMGETIVTPNHSIFTVRNGKIELCEAGKIGNEDLVVHVNRMPEVPEKNVMSDSLAKLAGYYVSEGHAIRYQDKTKGCWCHYVKIDNNSEDIIADVVESYSEEFNATPSIFVSDKRSGTIRTSIGGLRYYDLLVSTLGCGHRSISKRIPNILFTAPKSAKLAFFNAYYAGDGKSQDLRYKIRQYDMVTISPGLRDDLMVLSRILFPDRIPTLYKWKGRDAWKVYLSTKLKRKHSILKDVIGCEVTKVELVDPTEEYVYDLCVEGNQNFVDACGNMLLHNTDLAMLYERAGIIKGKKGSITQLPILTMVGDDITHPIPDLTGYITEGQIVLSRELNSRNVYPPIDVLPSLSRLMNLGIGQGKTREDQKQVSDQLYAFYAEGRDLRGLVAIVGEESLSERDRRILKFAADFEAKFVKQGRHEDRDIGKTLDIGWQLLSELPEAELTRISPELRKRYYGKH